MKRRVSVLAILLLLLATGCATSGSVTPQEAPLKSGEPLPPPPIVSSSPTPRGQVLPISAQVEIGGQQILLEVTQTPEEQAMGLMYRTALPDNRGMLFSFNPPQPVGFWMKNTLIPLDMIFLRDGVVQAIATNVPPCTTPTCPTYGPEVPIDQVIELRGGRAAQLGLNVGDSVEIEFLKKR